MGDHGLAIGAIGHKQLPHTEGVLEGPVAVLGAPVVELTHQGKGLRGKGVEPGERGRGVSGWSSKRGSRYGMEWVSWLPSGHCACEAEQSVELTNDKGKVLTGSTKVLVRQSLKR